MRQPFMIGISMRQRQAPSSSLYHDDLHMTSSERNVQTRYVLTEPTKSGRMPYFGMGDK
jgi:hypothetical protein